MIRVKKNKSNYFAFAIMITFIFFLIFIQYVNADGKELKGIYFYVPLCDNCEKIEKALETVDEKLSYENPDVDLVIKKYNINDNDSLELLYKYYEYYDVPQSKQNVPILFISNKFFQNDKEILSEIPKLAISDDLQDTPIIASEKIRKDFSIGDIASVMLAGFLNGLNPCSLSMLLFFLSIIITRKVNILKMGLAFTAGKFIAYLLLGTMLYSTLSVINNGYYKIVLKVLFVLFSSLLVYLNLKDYFATRREDYKNVSNQLPAKFRRYNHNIINRILENKSGTVLILMALILGLVISVGEFMCTGQIYVATMVYMLKSGTSLSVSAFISLLLYDFAFIMPPLLITILIAKGTDIFDISELIRFKLPIIKLLNAFIILLFCIIAIIFI